MSKIELTNLDLANVLSRLQTIEKNEHAIRERQERHEAATKRETDEMKTLLQQHSIHLRYLMAFGGVQVTILIGIFLKLLLG
jgi:hypothetical protein